jgi:hypothetical protein
VLVITERNNCINIVPFIDNITLRVSADHTAMRDDIPLLLYRKSHWFHQAATFRCPIPRMNVYMFGPQALRAMIGKTITSD